MLLTPLLFPWTLGYCHTFDKSCDVTRQVRLLQEAQPVSKRCILLWASLGFRAVILIFRISNVPGTISCKIFPLFTYAPNHREPPSVPSSGSHEGETHCVQNMPVLGYQIWDGLLVRQCSPWLYCPVLCHFKHACNAYTQWEESLDSEKLLCKISHFGFQMSSLPFYKMRMMILLELSFTLEVRSNLRKSLRTIVFGVFFPACAV